MVTKSCTPESASSGQAPIFLLSSIRAGSTLLRCILDAHPDVWGPPELRLGALCCASYHTAYWSGPGARRTQNLDDVAALDYVRRTVGALMAAGTAARGKKIWCEKSPQNWTHLPLLEKIFPDARFILISRNCLDVVHSCLELVWLSDRLLPELAAYILRTPDRLPAALARYWIDTNHRILECERRTGNRFHRVRYEDIVARPSETLRALFASLGLSWSDDLVASSFEDGHGDGPGDFKFRYTRNIHGRSVGKGSRFRRDQFPSDVLAQADELSRELGYPAIGEEILCGAPESDGAHAGAPDDLLTSAVPAFLSRAPAQEMRGRVLIGIGQHLWLAELGTGRWSRVPAMTEADATILVEEDLLGAIVAGKANPADLFAEGKLIIRGRLQTAYDLLNVLVPGASALT